MLSIAEHVIHKCGGPKKVADWLGIAESAVYRWRYEKERGGTGGRIPTGHQQALLDKARQENIDLSPADFFEHPHSEHAQ